MFLKRKNVSIYYEVKGEGAPLLLIHGLITDSGLYERAASYLSEFFKVITYDRRGNSRSILADPEGSCFSMDEQVDDIKALLDELSVSRVFIFGASAGAAIGFHFMQKYNGMVRHLIMYEPASRMVIDSTPQLAEKAYELINKRKFTRTLLLFSESIGVSDKRAPAKTEEEAAREYGNIEFAFTKEFSGILSYMPDIKVMTELRNRITIAAGELTPDTVYHKNAENYAKLSGAKMLYFPGGHNFPFELPEEFSVCILGTIISRCGRNILEKGDTNDK